jgi:hypothetical protein
MARVGDINAHSQRWHPRCTERRQVAYREQIIDRHGLEIGNDDRPTQYRTRNKCKPGSIIAQTLGIKPCGRWTIFDGNHATWSDHEIIQREVDMEKQQEA